jgi:formate hydrogenlyase subunit 6/NADH:ubiquinone oxidoreductase subunit I
MRIAAFLPELLRHLFKKPATVDYPFKKMAVPKDFRGTPYLQPELCIVCKACERDCPAEAIEIAAVGDPAEKRFRMVIHNDRCIHCAQCVDVCPTTPKAMQIDSLFEIAADDRHKLKRDWVYVRAVMKPKAPAAAPGTPAPAAEPKA